MAPPDCQNAKSYKNWSETVKFTPTRYCEPTTEQRVIDIVTEAGQATKRVRTVGAGHSFSQLVATPDTLLSLHELKTPAPTFNGNRATVPAGMSLKDLIQTLKQHSPSLALKNLGSITRQSIAGAISTGTHGTGVTLGSLSTHVMGVRLIDGTGNVRTFTDASPGDDLAAARVSLGALGVLTQVTLECVPFYQLEFNAYLCSLDDVLANIDSLVQNNKRMLFWWLLPSWPLLRHKVIVMTKNPVGTGVLPNSSDLGSPALLGLILKGLDQNLNTLLPILNALVGAGLAPGFRRILHFTADYDEVLTLPMPEPPFPQLLHRECEYAIPADPTDVAHPWKGAVDALRCFQRVVDESDVSLLMPVEVRFVAQDDVLLSAACGRNVCYIGASALTSHAPVPADNATEIFTRFEPIMREHGGMPHWGKIFSLTCDDVEALYSGTYNKFTAVRNALDPNRVFSNSMLDELFP